MTFLGLERPVEYGRELVFDPTTALMVLNANNAYINAARDEYLRAILDMKDFNKEYGDFLSPILKDMEWYEKNVTGDVRNFINNLYAQGIDPLRSVEGRVMVARKLANMPTGDIAKVRQSAEAAKEYIKNRGALEAAGKYNSDLEERFLGFDINNWDTIGGDLVWNRTSPIETKSLKELTESSYNNRTAHDLTKDEVLSFEGQTYDPRMRYKGFTDKDLLNIANTVAPGLTGTPWNDYYRDLAAQKVAASGKELTSKNIDAQLARDIADTLLEYLIKPIGDLSEWLQQENLAINREKLSLARQKAAAARKEQESNSWTFRQQVASMIKAQGSGDYEKSFSEWLRKDGGLKGLNIAGWSKINGYYNATQHTLPESGDRNTASNLFNGGEGSSTRRGLNSTFKENVVTFGDQTLRPTRTAEFEWAGLSMTKGSGSYKLAKFLRENAIEGTPTGKISINYKSQGGMDLYEINRSVKVDMSKLDGYFKDMTEEKKINTLLNLGLSVVTTTGKVIGGGEKGTLSKDVRWKDIELVIIPSSRRINAMGYDNAVIDIYHDETAFGKSQAAKRESGHLSTPWSGLSEDYDE